MVKRAKINSMANHNSYPDLGNPRHVRALMDNCYARYIHGKDMFPKIRISDPEDAPTRSRQIANALFREWGVIDDDNAYFTFALEKSVENFRGVKEPAQGIIHTKVGRNAVNFAYLRAEGDGSPVSVAYGVEDVRSFVEKINGTSYQLTDGRTVGFEGGGVTKESDPANGMIVRQNGTSGIYVARADLAA